MKRNFSQRLFTVALLLLPRWFRDQYGDDMMRNFVERSQTIGRQFGWAGRVAFQIRCVLEVPGQALRVRQKRGTSRRGAGGALGSWMQELRIAARSLAQRPGFALGVALTLGLGVGATTTIYSVVDGVLFRPLPYDDPSTLVVVGSLALGAEWIDGETGLQDLAMISMPNYLDFQERTRSLAVDPVSVLKAE